MLSGIRTFFRRRSLPSTLVTSEDATIAFLELFWAHGLAADIKDGWIIADSRCLSAQARIYKGIQTPTGISVQLCGE